MRLTRLDASIKEALYDLMEVYFSVNQHLYTSYDEDTPFDYAHTDLFLDEISKEVTRVLNGNFDVHDYFDMCVLDFIEEHIVNNDLGCFIEDLNRAEFRFLNEMMFTINGDVKIAKGD